MQFPEVRTVPLVRESISKSLIEPAPWGMKTYSRLLKHVLVEDDNFVEIRPSLNARRGIYLVTKGIQRNNQKH